MSRALFVGGCPASYHRLEPAEPFVRSVLERLGLIVDVSGIYHPDGGEMWAGDYSLLSAEALKQYDIVVLFTTGQETRGAEIDSLIAWNEAGGGLVGIHCATDSFTDNPKWVAHIGGKFRTHPSQLDIALEVIDGDHPITKGLQSFTVKDELYLFADYDPGKVHLLAETNSFADESHVPLVWTKQPGAGRLVYISLGHNPSTMETEAWQDLFASGVEWALNRK